MITRRVFGFLAGAAPVFGKEVAKAAVAEPFPMSNVTGAVLCEYEKVCEPSSPDTYIRAINSNRLSNMKDMLEKARKFALGPNDMPYFRYKANEHILFDADLLSSRSFSLAGAEAIQRQRNKVKAYHKSLKSFKVEFLEKFGVDLDLNDLSSGKYDKLLADMGSGLVPMPNVKKSLDDDCMEDCSDSFNSGSVY